MSDNLVIRPQGKFDLVEVRAWLDRRPELFENPRYEDSHYVARYTICGYPHVAVYCYERRLTEPWYHPYDCDVYLAEDQFIVVRENSDDEDDRVALEFLDWLIPRFECTVTSDGYPDSGYGRDYTEAVRQHGAGALYSEEVRAMALPCAGTLIAIGFYWELDHGDSGGPGLEVACQPEAGPDDEQLARYLESGAVLYRADAPARVWHDHNTELPPPHTLTDGLYMWPADLPYYLRRYHVRLPRAFVLRAKDLGWRVPEVDVSALPPFTPYNDPADILSE